MASVPDSCPTTTYIYALCEPGTEVAAGELPPASAVHYVGKAVKPAARLRQHLYHAYRSGFYVHRWLRKVLASGKEPAMLILERCEGDAWVEREPYWIAHYRELGARLKNLTDGGEGVLGLAPESLVRRNASIKIAHSTPEMRAIHRAGARKIFTDPNIQERYREGMAQYWARTESLARRSVISKALWSDPMFKAKTSAAIKRAYENSEVRARQSLHMKAILSDPTIRAALSTRMKRRYESSEARREHGIKMTEVLARPDVKAKMRTALIKRMQAPEGRAKTSHQFRALWADPSYRERTTASLKRATSSPEYCARLSRIIKETWQNPAIAEGRSSGFRRMFDDPARMKKRHESQKLAQADPELRKRLSEIRKAKIAENPDLVAKMRAGGAAMWADPEKRQKRIEIMKEAWVRRKAKAQET